MADILLEEFMFRYGIPHQIHSDQGSEFDSELIRELCKLLRIHKTRTTAYHPQSDGQVERANRTIKALLSSMVNDSMDDWDERLPYATFAYRTSTHATTKCTPNLLMLGREINLPIDLLHPPEGIAQAKCPVHYVEWIKNAAKHAYNCARLHGMTNQDRQARNYNFKSGTPGFSVGQSVWWYYPPIAQKKFGRKWFGPYLVVEKLPGEVRYKIKRSQFSNDRVVHVDQLKLYEGCHPIKSWIKEAKPKNKANTDRRASAPRAGDPLPQAELEQEDEILRNPAPVVEPEPYFGEQNNGPEEQEFLAIPEPVPPALEPELAFWERNAPIDEPEGPDTPAVEPSVEERHDKAEEPEVLVTAEEDDEALKADEAIGPEVAEEPEIHDQPGVPEPLLTKEKPPPKPVEPTRHQPTRNRKKPTHLQDYVLGSVLHPCVMCQTEVGDEGIQCDNCRLWQHRKCNRKNAVMTLAKYNKLKNKDFPWQCTCCRNLLGPQNDR